MTVPSIVSSATSTFTDNVQIKPVNYPSTFSVGDLLVCVGGNDDDDKVWTSTGWTQVGNDNYYSPSSQSSVTAGCLYKVATAGDVSAASSPGTFDLDVGSTRNAVFAVYAFENWSGTIGDVVPLEAINGGNTASSNSPVAPAISVTSGDWLFLQWYSIDDAAGTVSSYPSGWTLGNLTAASTNSRPNCMGSAALGASGSTGVTPTAFTANDTDTWVAAWIAIPGSGGGGGFSSHLAINSTQVVL